jgi:hypothetical protein
MGSLDELWGVENLPYLIRRSVAADVLFLDHLPKMHLVTDTADYVLENPPLSPVEAEASQATSPTGIAFPRSRASSIVQDSLWIVYLLLPYLYLLLPYLYLLLPYPWILRNL